MSNLPVDPAADSRGDEAPPLLLSQDMVVYNTPNPTANSPRRIEDLDPPFSAYPHIPLHATLYPENAVYGLAIRHVTPYAYFVFEKWTGWSLSDFYALYLDDLLNAVAADITLEDEPRYGLFVPREHVPEGEIPMYGRVLRAGTFQESTSPLQTILIKTTRPGGTDTDPGSEWHTGLVMTVEGLPEGSTIDRLIAEGGVWCLIEPYEHIRQNDRIELSWDGIFVIHIVSPAEAAGSGPIRIFVSKDIILQGGQLGPLTLRFRVQDVVENMSGEKYAYSKRYILMSELDPSLLEAPIFMIDSVESTQVDVDTQSDAVFTLSCFTGRQIPAPNPPHKVIATLYATLADGSTPPFTLPAVNATNTYLTTVPVSNDVIKQIVGGSFRVSFVIEDAHGVFIGKSGSITVTVIGTPVSMPGVTINPIELGLIDPEDDITVTIPFYEPHSPDWLETLYIEHRIPGGGGTPYIDSQLAGTQGGSRYVSKEDLQQFNGLGLIYFYYVVTDGVTTRKSAEVGAQVGERVVDMPQPQLQGTEGNNINPDRIPGPTVLLTLPYLDARDGDVYHWICVGSALGGSANGTIHVNAATQGQPLTFPVSRTILDFNLNGSLRISYSLERVGPPRQVLRSEVLNLTVGVGVELDRPEVAEAQRFPDRLDPLAVLSGAHVIVKFRPMHATDRIFIDWLSPDGNGSYATEVQGNPATNEVSVPIPSEFIAKGIRQDGNLISVQYHFFRGAIPYESDVLNLELLPLTGLPTPTIDGVGDSMVLQLSQINDAARTRVSVWNFIAANQRMWMTYEGTYADDTPFIENTYTANLVTTIGETNGISPPAPVDKLRRLKDGSRLTIRFWVTLSESLSKDQAVLFGVREHIVQAIPSTLPAPAFANLVGPTLSIYPLDYENTAWVTVAYAGMNGTQLITLQWIYPNTTVASIPAKYGLDGGRVDFTISQKILADSVGKTITLRYVAVINGDEVDSFTQTLNVENIQASDLPAPLINYLPNGATLDLRNFSGNATISVPKWRLSQQGQRVWLECLSVGAIRMLVLDGVAIISSEAANGLINKPVLRNWLNQLRSGAEVVVHCRVAFDASTTYATATPFPQTRYIVIGQIPQFTIPTTTLVLNGVSVRVDWPRTGMESLNNTATRVASGGVPPYTYTSSNPSVAAVNAATGYVIGNANGSSTITARDRNNSTASYVVQVSNVYRLLQNGLALSFGAALAWRNTNQALAVDITAENDMKRRYHAPWPAVRNYWYCDDRGVGCAANYSIYYDSTARAALCQYIYDANANFGAWCLQRI